MAKLILKSLIMPDKDGIIFLIYNYNEFIIVQKGCLHDGRTRK
ncbi:MAG: hypothetical protein H6Q64_899 [Firmicutes bacterium]|nr:hypothetical protein [Bacillota bacterium]